VSRATILAAWLERLGPLAPAADPFRDPVGYTVREALPVLLDVALGSNPVEDAVAPLERLMRIRAVQDLTPAQAVGFLFELKPLLREFGGPADFARDGRIDALALLAFDRYVRCREDAHAIQLRELRRRFAACP
jgi:RsbT co-antagonist protein rsbRD N-terminal domain